MPLLDSVTIVPELATPAPPAAPANVATARPPLIAPPLVSVVIVSVLDTPAPPTTSSGEEEPKPPAIVPLLASVDAEQTATRTPAEPVAPPEPVTIPEVVTAMAPPSLTTGPVLDVEMV